MRYTKGDHLGCYKDLDIPKQWENESWGNDTMASFRYKNTRIWIDYPNRKDRQMDDLNPYRFHVQIFESKDWLYADDEPIGKEYDTNSFEDVLEYLKRLFKVDGYQLLEYIDFTSICEDFNLTSGDISPTQIVELENIIKEFINQNITK